MMLVDHTTPAYDLAPDELHLRTSWTATELLATEFPAPRWAVPGLLAEGLNLLAGAPKLGKSWLALNVSLAIASGGRALGAVQVDQGDALYLALEDTPRRLQHRLQLVLGDDAAPDGLTFETAWPKVMEGGDAQLEGWLAEHPGCRLVVVDVLSKVRPRSDPRSSVYDADYFAMTALKALADRYSVALLVLHHTRKAGSDDFIDTVSGTHGLAGAADAVLVMQRARNAADAELHITGRDVEEAERAMRFDPSRGLWTLLEGPAEDYQLRDVRRRVLGLLRDAGPLRPKQIAERLGIKPDAAKQTCRRMAEDDQLANDGEGFYSAPHSSAVTPVPDVTLPGMAGGDVGDVGDTRERASA